MGCQRRTRQGNSASIEEGTRARPSCETGTLPLEFVPMVGPLAGAVIVLLVAGLSGSHHLFALFAFLVVFRFLQDYVVSPHLLSAGMKLHPLLIIFGVLAGGSIAGIAGCFLSVPVLATLRIVYRQILTKAPPAVVAPDAAAPL